MRAQIATRKGLFYLEKNGGGWRVGEPQFLGAPVIVTLEDPRSGYHYAALNHGHFGSKLHHSADGGRTWEEVGTPTYPPKPEDVPDVVDPTRNVAIPWSLVQMWALETGAAEGQLWCGTIPGGLFRSDDHGATWELNRPLWDRPERSKWFGGGYDYPGIHSVCVDPRDRRRLAVGISCGGVWVTEDDGATWTCKSEGMRAAYMPPDQQGDPNVQDPHRMVQCPGEPDKYWVQHHNGIFRSANNLERWEEVENVKPSGFGFAVAVHPRRGDTAWFVPGVKDEVRVPVDGRFVVTRTTDGGKSFETLNRGLPGEASYDLVYRHALEVDETGNTLVMGSTTGSLWVSEDGGDTWQLANAHLPPIYSVRIVS